MADDPLVVLRRAVAIHAALSTAGIGHAIGGALALAYHVGEARSTQDIDINVALPKERAAEALAALPSDVPWSQADLDTIRQDGQVRLRWPVASGPPVPLDLFFAEHEFHAVADRRAVWVPMLGSEVPILAATDLTVFKALFDRSKDWVDIEAMLAEAPPTLDIDDALAWLTRIVGASDPRVDRLRALAAG